MSRMSMSWRRGLIVLFLAVQVISVGAVLLPAAAAAAGTNRDLCSGSGSTFLNFPTWYKYIYTWTGTECRIDFDINNPNTIAGVLLAIFEIVLRIGGIAAVIFIVYGGFQYLMARGESDRTRGARQTIINALIGLMIAIFATALVNFIAGNI